MGATGALILGFFGAVFASLTLYWHGIAIGLLLLLPFVGFVAIGAAAIGVLRMPGVGVVPSPAEQRAITWSSVAEGVALFVVGNLVVNLHRPDLLLPGMALVVGAHFLPIAHAAGFRPFYLLGWSLIAVAVIGAGLGSPFGGEVAGFMAAATLWLAALMALRRDRLARMRPASIAVP